ncbi:MAG: cysteine hydrolase [Treponemataceae bacterium]|nr:cysteine hydrolase [Treponemataceae bacterium]
MVLLVVDTQKGLMNDGLYAFETVCANISRLIEESRANNVEVIFVRHDDGPGSGFSKGDADWEIYKPFAPLANEKIFEKTVNSAFHIDTGLETYLKEKGEKELMICGVQTDYCIDATVKGGFERGYHIFVPGMANSTKDNDYFPKNIAYRYYNEFMWPDRYADCITMEEAVVLLKEGM